MQTIEKYFHTFNFPTFYFAVSLSLSHTWSYLHTRVVFGQILLQIMRGTHVLHSNLKGDAFFQHARWLLDMHKNYHGFLARSKKYTLTKSRLCSPSTIFKMNKKQYIFKLLIFYVKILLSPCSYPAVYESYIT